MNCSLIPDAAFDQFFTTKGFKLHMKLSSDRNCFPGEIELGGRAAGDTSRDELREKAGGEIEY